ncbi:T-complex protein 1 subunit zeta [Pelomyxa schiedti]|nr:T-complex protein 1 subunit zeta [Pelomyxa schiedti]
MQVCRFLGVFFKTFVPLTELYLSCKLCREGVLFGGNCKTSLEGKGKKKTQQHHALGEMATGVKVLNPTSEVSRRDQALAMNLSAAKGLMEVLKSNLGPKGTIKMLVSGGGDIKLTKDGNVLLHEMQIQHPTANLIARAATAQDDITGDGTTSIVILIGELLKLSERHLSEGIHSRTLTDGFELAKTRALQFLDEFKIRKEVTRDVLIAVAYTSLATKLDPELARQLSTVVVDALLTIQRPGEPLDLFMVEIMHMKHRQATETRLVRGLVMDHGARHPDMPKRVENAFVLTCNVSMEYEKSEVNAGLFYRSAQERTALAAAERKVCDDTVMKAIELKRKVCDTPDKHFIIVNQKGIDPPSLQMLADEGIIALRRAKRRNMERLTLCCGGTPLNSFEGMGPEVLGHAGVVYEHVLGEEKYTFVEECKNPGSCTILIKGPDDHTINQIKDAVRDGLRAVKNAIEDQSVVPGAGAFEVALYRELMRFKDASVTGRAKLGVQVFAEALLIIPKTLSENAGFDPIDSVLAIQDEFAKGRTTGVNLLTGQPMDPVAVGILDNTCVKRQMINSSAVIATELLLVDVIMRAGKSQGNKPPGPDAGPMD